MYKDIPREINWDGKTKPECGQQRLMGWSLRLNKKVGESQLNTAFSSLALNWVWPVVADSSFHQLSNAVLYHIWWNEPSEPWARINTCLPCFYGVVCHSNEKGKQSTVFPVLIFARNMFKILLNVYFRFTEQNCQQVPLRFTIYKACL